MQVEKKEGPSSSRDKKEVIRLSKNEYRKANKEFNGKFEQAIRAKNIEEAMKAMQERVEWNRWHEPTVLKLKKSWEKGEHISWNLFRRLMLVCTDYEKHHLYVEDLFEKMSKMYGEVVFLKNADIVKMKFIVLEKGKERIKKGMQLVSTIVGNNKLSLKRRMLEVLLGACADENDIQTAFKIRDIAIKHNCEFGGAGYVELLRVCSNCSKTDWDRGKIILQDVFSKVNVLDNYLVEAIETWCNKRSISTEKDLSADTKGRCTPSSDRKQVCKLPHFKLSQDQAKVFSEAILKHQISISSLSEAKTREAFDDFIRWLDGAKDKNKAWALIDAANCGFHGNSGNFSYKQADLVYIHFKFERNFASKLLISQSRWEAGLKMSTVNPILQYWMHEKSVFITPKGLNDDAFWMYGAIYLSTKHTLSNVFIVSNDLLRDHHLMQNYDLGFFRFMQSHIIRFRTAQEGQQTGRRNKKRKTEHKLVFYDPFPYSIQPHRTTAFNKHAIVFPYMAKSSDSSKKTEGSTDEKKDLLVKDLYKAKGDDDLPALPEVVADRVRW
eukprot:CAMPEP_0167746072 /NCGR_PEP_ID=MMETSP0110_2-20121227/3506_1 /TAXON_ID=629695 /ORGANISM="Gymnochlora sp., Strain CCMP2014" /LENGTH=551 /DNA_ID=CAMNT_0007630789 /DNA_START=55 /DNA_END=1707 /DNA_ORIENTATION=-